MRITLDNACMFSDMFERYKEKVYRTMLEEEYDMHVILRFCTGYGIVSESIGRDIMNRHFQCGYDIPDIYEIPFAKNLEDALEFIETIRSSINKLVKNPDDIIKCGIDYAFNTALYYIRNIIYGDSVVNHDRLLIDIPNLYNKIA